MTLEEEQQHQAELLLELEQTRKQMRLLEGPLADWGKKLSGLASRMMEQKGLELDPEDLQTIAAFPKISALVNDAIAISARLRDLEDRRRRIFGDS